MKKNSIKILLIGGARNGKDTVAQILKDNFKLEFESSSEAAVKIFLYNALKDKYNYKSYQECFEDRINHRAEWFDLITEYNLKDKARLAKQILLNSDIYVGMRSKVEFDKCKQDEVFDLIVGVYDERKPLEDKSSFDIDIFKESNFIIPNCGTLEELEEKVIKTFNKIL